MILLLAHITGCIFIIIGSQNEYNPTWLTKFESTIYSKFDIYIASIYWSIVTMITLGYGDIVPLTTSIFYLIILYLKLINLFFFGLRKQNVQFQYLQNVVERIYVICMAFVSCGMFAYSVNTIGETLREKKKNKDDFKNRIMSLSNFMKARNINRELREQIFRHQHYLFKKQTQDSAGGIQMLNSMPESLKQTVIVELYYNLLNSQPYFSETFDHKFLYQLCPLVKEIQLGAGMLIDETAFPSKESFYESVMFVIQGEIGYNIRTFIKTLSYQLSIKKGDCINLHQFLTGQSYSITPKLKSLSMVTIAYIQRSEFIQLLNDFPTEKEKFFQSQDKVGLINQIDLLKQKCQSCGKLQHEASKCPIVHPSLNRDKLIHNSNRTIFQQREKEYTRKRQKSPAILKFIMVEMSPDFCPTQMSEYNQKKSHGERFQGNVFGDIRENSNNVGTIINIAAPPGQNDNSIHLYNSSSKNHFSSNMNGIQNIQNSFQVQDIASMLQPYSLSEVGSNLMNPNIPRQSLSSIKGIELFQKYRQRLNSMKSRTIGSQGLIQHPESMQTSVFSKNKQTHHEFDINDSSLISTDIQKPYQNDNDLAFNRYFNEEDIQMTQKSNISIETPIQLPVTVVGQFSNNHFVFNSPHRSGTKHLSYYANKMQQQQNQSLFFFEEQKDSKMYHHDVISPKIMQNSSQFFHHQQKMGQQSEDNKISDPTTMSKIQSDLTLSVKHESLNKQASKRTHTHTYTQPTSQNYNNKGSLRTIRTGIIKLNECKYDNSLKKNIQTNINIPSQNDLSYLEDKCFEIDVRKDYIYYFANSNCDIVIAKYNEKIMKVSQKTQKKINNRRGYRNTIAGNTKLSLNKLLPKSPQL